MATTTKPTIIYAETVPYFATSTVSTDAWLDKAKDEIRSVNGKIVGEAFGADGNGRSAFMLAFSIGDEQFRLTWPVLPSKSGKDKAAKIQAATALYHDVKARVVSAKFLGVRGAFFTFLMLPNGRTASETAANEFMTLLPDMTLLLGSGR